MVKGETVAVAAGNYLPAELTVTPNLILMLKEKIYKAVSFFPSQDMPVT